MEACPANAIGRRWIETIQLQMGMDASKMDVTYICDGKARVEKSFSKWGIY
jgi:hypothetical protein